MTMTVKEFLQAEIDKKIDRASDLAKEAEKASRQLSGEEKQYVETLLSDVTQLKGQIQEIDDRDALQKSIDDMRGPINQPPEEVKDAGTIGEAFVKSEGYQALLNGGMKSTRWSSNPIEFGAKTLLTEDTASGGTLIQPDVQAGIKPTLFQRLTVANLLASGTTNSNMVRYLQEITATNAAAAVLEGGQKPESALVFDDIDEPVRKIATFLPVTDEMLQDVAQIQSYLNERLRLFVQITEEAELLNGAASSPPHLVGLLNRTGILTGSALSLDTDSSIDAIYKGITQIRVQSFLEPDGIVVHPVDWSGIRLMKDDNAQYYGGGPFTGAYGNAGGMAADSVWGLPAVVTSAIPQGTALIGAFRLGGQVFRNGGLTVEASNSHADFFQYNKTAIRAEERLALAVYRPKAFYKLTGIDLLLGS